jgi:hypothetical protein
MIEASDAAFVMRRAAASVSGSASSPAIASSSRPPWSITHTLRSSGTWSRIVPTVEAWSPVSTTTPAAWESPRIQATCSAADVS